MSEKKTHMPNYKIEIDGRDLYLIVQALNFAIEAFVRVGEYTKAAERVDVLLSMGPQVRKQAA